MKKVLAFLGAFLLVGSLLTVLASGTVLAARNIDSVEIRVTGTTPWTDVYPGGATLNTDPGDEIDLQVTAELTSGSAWRSTGVRIATDDGPTYHCIVNPTPFTTDGTHTLTGVNMPKNKIPPTHGVRNLYLKLYSNSSCTGSHTQDTYPQAISQGPIAESGTINAHVNNAVSGNVLDFVHVNANVDGTTISTATLVQDVTSGNLTFNEDGSFTYTPVAAFVGSTTFTYSVPFIALDGPKVTAPATVTITVGLPPKDESPEKKAIENAGPNDGDANDDGTLDSEQINVSSLINPVTSTYAVLDNTDYCTNQNVDVTPASHNAVTDPGFEYPAGLMHFTLYCGSEFGLTTTVTQYYYGVNAADLVARKYNTVTNTYQAIPGAVIEETTIGGQTVTKLSYQITDGGELDEDGVANGVIVDPSGLATNRVGAPDTGLGGQAASVSTPFTATTTFAATVDNRRRYNR